MGTVFIIYIGSMLTLVDSFIPLLNENTITEADIRQATESIFFQSTPSERK